jgi:hypothetical protein
VYTLKLEPGYTDPSLKADWKGLGISALKTLEVVAMWRVQGDLIWCVAGLPWFYFFICAGLLHQQRLSRGYINDTNHIATDVIAGQLPVPSRAGNERKVILGVPQDFRRSSLWKAVWACGSIVCTASLITLYVLVATQESIAIYIWLGFQLFWLLLRSIYFHFSQVSRKGAYHSLIQGDLHSIDSTTRKRVLNLILALSQYQIHNHPRGFYSYEDELLAWESTEAISSWIQDHFRPYFDTRMVKHGDHKSKEVNFVSVIGDTYLSSAAWLHGSKLTGIDLYDSCIAIISYTGTLFAIPSARVLGGLARNKIDVEKAGLPQHPPKGSSNWGPDAVQWIYWIPCSDGRWLETRTEDMKIIGRREFELLTDSDITRRLSKMWFIFQYRIMIGLHTNCMRG